MSLENALAAATAAMIDLTAALKGGKVSAADKAIGAEAARATAAKPAAAKPNPAAKKAVTLDTIKERFGAYLAVENKAERKARIANVQAIVDHFGVEKASALGEENWVEALGYLTKYEAGEEPEFSNEGGEEEDGDGPSII